MTRLAAYTIGALLVGCGHPGDPASDPDTVGAEAAAAAVSVAHRQDKAPAWTVGHGDEFWRRPKAAPHVAPSEVNFGDVIDRVSHAIDRTNEGARPGTRARTYAAEFDGYGLRFSPRTTQRSVEDPTTELRLRTARISTGGRDLYLAGARPVPWSVLGNTVQGLLDQSAGVIEHHEARADGVEVSWIVRDRAAIFDDLVVNLALEGLAFAGQTAEGTHFADSSGVARVRIGVAELVDARGLRWPVATEIVEGQPQWRVDAKTLALASFPIALDPTISAELGMDQPITSNDGEQLAPSVASNGAGYFAVWQDDREGTSQIYGARIAASGAIQDPRGVRVSPPTAINCYLPSVASNGSDYLVAWQDTRSGRNDIYAARVTAGGAVPLADAAGVPVSTATESQAEPSVASNGTDYLVAWEDRRSGTDDIYGARFTAAGAVPTADAAGIAISTATGAQSRPSVASDGTNYLVVWADIRSGSSSDIYAARVTASGAVADAAGIAVSTETDQQDEPSVASNGIDYLAAWSDGRSGISDDIYAARITAGGTVGDAAGIAVSTATNQQDQPSVASNGSDYIVAWSDDRSGISSEIYAARVTAAGTVPAADTAGIPISTATTGAKSQPFVASDGIDYLVAWTDPRSGTSADIYAARLTAAGGVPTADAAGIPVSVAFNQQFEPSAASNGSRVLVAWADSRHLAPGDARSIYAARVSLSGVIEDLAGIAVSTAANDQLQPSVASNGTDYLVAWTDQRSGSSSSEIYAARVTAAGAVPTADATGIPVSTNASFRRVLPSVASNGVDYLVAWQDYRVGIYCDIYAARVTSAGVVPSADAAGIPLSTAGGEQGDPSVASDGTDYLVAWYDDRNNSVADIYAARVTSAGAVPAADAAGIQVSTATSSQVEPSVASNGTDYLVAWRDFRSTSNYDIYAARVTAGAVPAADAGGIPISTFASNQKLPSVASDGTNYLVAWQDFRASNDIYAARVTSAGTVPVQDGTGIPIAASRQHETAPQVAGSVGGPYLITYEARRRIAARLFTSCGDGVIDSGETCDDGAAVGGDGCSAACAVEPGHTCSGVPSTCTDVNECASGNGGCDQVCTNTTGAFTCSCTSGYVLATDGLGCVDIDECATNNGGCAINVTCLNTPGAFTCGNCPAGYTGDGVTCTDIDECASSNGGCAETCTNTVGDYVCSCGAGYLLAANAHSCEDVDECATNNGGCAAGMTCSNTPGSHTCGSCPAGFTGEGMSCRDLDECVLAMDNCSPDATCSNTMGSFDCTCTTGFVGDGVTCTPDEDEPVPPQPPEDTGCGCTTGDPKQSLLLACLLGWFVRRRRRASRI